MTPDIPDEELIKSVVKIIDDWAEKERQNMK